MQAFDNYLKEGGFPEVLKRHTTIEKKELLQTYYRTIYYRDILDRYNIKAKYVLEAVMGYSLNTFSDLFSISTFEKHLKRHGLPGSKQTISNYLRYLEAFFIIAHDKYSYSARKRIMNPKKIHLLDTGFSSLASDFPENRGKLLENCVAVELFRRLAECFNFAREAGVSHPTAKEYLNALAQSQLTFQLQGYHFGPAKRFLKATKTYFADNGVIHSLNVPVGEGPLLENFVIAELEKRRKLGYISADRFYYYKSAAGHEVDLIFETGDTLHAIEIKSTRKPGRKDITQLVNFIPIKKSPPGDSSFTPATNTQPWTTFA